MAKKLFACAAIVLMIITLDGSAALSAQLPAAEMRTARMETTAMPPVAAPVPAKPGTGFDELRDCAALVLVGGMLIGLAAAVRRTA